MQLELYKNLYSMNETDFWKNGIDESFAEVDKKVTAAFAGSFDRVTFVGCGTSNFAGIYGRGLFEKLLGIPCAVLEGNTARYTDDKLYTANTLYIGISNTGNSGTVVESMQLAHDKGCKTLCITGDETSKIAKASDVVLFFAGKKDTVPTKTRSYVETLMMLAALAIKLCELKGVNVPFTRAYFIGQAEKLAHAAQGVFAQYSEPLKALADRWKGKHSYNVVGANLHQATAQEGSLKICEIGWVNSQAMELENYLHGKLRGVDGESPYFIVGTDDISYPLMLTYVGLAKKTGADAVVVSDHITKPVKDLAAYYIEIEAGINELLKPFIFIIPFYIFGMYLGIARGHENPSVSHFDRPAQNTKLSDIFPEYGEQ